MISGRNEWAQSGCRRPSAQPPGEACQASIGEGQTGRGGSSALHSCARGHSPGELLRPASSCFVVASMTMHSCAASRAMPGIIFSILSVASDVRPILRCSRVLRIVGSNIQCEWEDASQCGPVTVAQSTTRAGHRGSGLSRDCPAQRQQCCHGWACFLSCDAMSISLSVMRSSATGFLSHG